MKLSELENIIFESISSVINKSYEDRSGRIINYIKGFGSNGKLPSFSGSIKELYREKFNEAYEWASKSSEEVNLPQRVKWYGRKKRDYFSDAARFFEQYGTGRD